MLCSGPMKRVLKLLVLVAVAVLVVFGALAAWDYKTDVVDNPGPGFTRDEVLAIIARESPIYYRDGVTPLGVFFEKRFLKV